MALANVLRSNQNLKLVTLDVAEFLQNTVFDGMKIPENPSLLSGMVRLALVAKLGGLSADFDVIGVKKLDTFFKKHPLYIAPVSSYAVGDFFFGFVHGHPFVIRIMELLRDHYNRSEYIDVPAAINRLIKDVSRESVEKSISRQWVKNVYIPPVDFACQVNSSSQEFLSKNGDMVLENSHVCRLGNAPAIQVNSTSLLAQVARKFCPLAFWMSEDKF
jgi:Alpha 1,4-glycosyltransferase conserved region